MFCIDKTPTHQSSSESHSETGVSIPSLIDSLIPGMESRCNDSVIAFQSSSETRTALPLFPVITIGWCVLAASSIKLYSFDRASVALRIVMLHSSLILAYVIPYAFSSITLSSPEKCERSEYFVRWSYLLWLFSSLTFGTKPINPAFFGGGFSLVLYQRESGSHLRDTLLSFSTHSGR